MVAQRNTSLAAAALVCAAALLWGVLFSLARMRARSLSRDGEAASLVADDASFMSPAPAPRTLREAASVAQLKGSAYGAINARGDL